MKVNKGIWKTGVLAIVIALAASMFGMRLSDWSHGLNSEFIVHGQTGGNMVASTGTAAVGVRKIIPQVVAGSGYKTVIQIINTSSATVTVTAEFYKQDGAVSTETYSKANGGDASASFAGTTGATIPVNGILVLKAEKATGDLYLNWAAITSTGTVTIASTFEYRENNRLLSRVGVAASSPDMKQFVVPRQRDTVSGQDIGFAVVNAGSTTATAMVTLRGASGQVLATKALTLGPKQQIAKFIGEFFGTLLSDPAGTSYTFLTFSSDQAQFAALALTVEGSNLASFPVDRLQ